MADFHVHYQPVLAWTNRINSAVVRLIINIVVMHSSYSDEWFANRRLIDRLPVENSVWLNVGRSGTTNSAANNITLDHRRIHHQPRRSWRSFYRSPGFSFWAASVRWSSYFIGDFVRNSIEWANQQERFVCKTVTQVSFSSRHDEGIEHCLSHLVLPQDMPIEKPLFHHQQAVSQAWRTLSLPTEFVHLMRVFSSPVSKPSVLAVDLLLRRINNPFFISLSS